MAYWVSRMAYRIQKKIRSFFSPILHTPYPIHARERGFTLVETLVAVTLLTIAIVAPMTLTTMSFSAAYYAREQITAFHLAQEGIEAIRHIRDGNILRIALNASPAPLSLMEGVSSTNGAPFTVDALNDNTALCQNPCQPLRLSNGLYGYGSGEQTQFVRTVSVRPVASNSDEFTVEVTVTWQTATRREHSVTIFENMYSWVQTGSAAQ